VVLADPAGDARRCRPFRQCLTEELDRCQSRSERYRPATRSAGSAIYAQPAIDHYPLASLDMNPAIPMKNGPLVPRIRHPRRSVTGMMRCRCSRPSYPRVGSDRKDGGSIRFVDAKFTKPVKVGESWTATGKVKRKHYYGPERTGFRLPSRRGTLPAPDRLAEVGYTFPLKRSGGLKISRASGHKTVKSREIETHTIRRIKQQQGGCMPSRIVIAYWHDLHANRIAIVSRRHETYAQLWTPRLSSKQRLAELGLAPGDRIALLMQNSSRYLEV